MRRFSHSFSILAVGSWVLSAWVVFAQDDLPSLTYGSYYGTEEYEQFYEVEVDGAGNIYVTVREKEWQWFIHKYSPDGRTLLYRTEIPQVSSVGGLAVNEDGTVYLAGTTRSIAFVPVNALQAELGLGQRDHQGYVQNDAFIMQLNTEGQITFASFWGGNGYDTATDIVLGNDGSIVVVGSTSSTTFPVVNALYPEPAGHVLESKRSNGTPTTETTDAFVAKFSPGFSETVFSTYLGGFQRDSAFAAAVNGLGEIFVTGTTQSPEFPVTQDAFQGQIRPASDAFLSKFNSAGGSLLYSSYYGGFGFLQFDPPYLTYGVGENEDAWNAALLSSGPNYQEARSVTVRNEGPVAVTVELADKIYKTGFERAFLQTADGFSLGPGAESTITYEWNARAVIGSTDKINPFAWFSYQPLSGNDHRYDYTVGLYLGREPEPVELKRVLTRGGTTNDTISRELGQDTFNNIVLDDLGNIYLSGSTTSWNFPIVNGLDESFDAYPEYRDGVVVKLDASGTISYSTLLSGSLDHESVTGLAVDGNGIIWAVGSTLSPTFTLSDEAVWSEELNRGAEDTGKLVWDGFVAKIDPGLTEEESLLFSNYLGGSRVDTIHDIAFGLQGEVILVGNTDSEDMFTKNPQQDSYGGGNPNFHGQYPDDGWIGILGGDPVQLQGEVCEVIKLAGAFDPLPANNKAFFVREQEGEDPLEVEAEVVEVSASEICLRVPVGILGDRLDQERFPAERKAPAVIRLERLNPGNDPTIREVDFLLLYPRLLLYDQIAIPAPEPGRYVLPQYDLDGPDDVATFWFLGRSVDESAGLRVQNTRVVSQQAPLPLQLASFTEVFRPSEDETPEVTGSLEIDRGADEKKQLNVSENGIWVVCVRAGPESSFPAPFQIHLSGDTSTPQALLNDGLPEGPRAIRPDTLFNHPAPRWERLTGAENSAARTTLFKFAKSDEVTPFADAVLIPTTPEGFRLAEPDPARYLRRARDPMEPGQLSLSVNDPTNPAARTPALTDPQPGEVIDYTQLPFPASAIEETGNPGGATTALNQTVGAVLGAPGLGLSISLPSNGLTSLICDLGSGKEAVDKDGADLRVHAEGNYAVAVGNTPFAADFVLLAETVSGTDDFDLAASGLTSARYVRVTAASSVQLDAVQALNTFYEDQVFDSLRGTNVALTRAERMTFTARREKAPATEFDPVLELIRPDGTLNQPIDDQGFGDPTSQFLTDAALTNRPLEQAGLYRVLGRGDRDTTGAQFGSFFARLETGGEYDPNPITVPAGGEVEVQPQRTGTLNVTRERDSYLVTASPGQGLNLVLSGNGNTPIADPILELHDPEGILIAANDNFPERGRDAVISVILPTLGLFGEPLPDPSTYRVVVGGIDSGGQTPLTLVASGSRAFPRQPDQGGYALQVFSGPLDSGGSEAAPDIRLSPSTLDFGTLKVGIPAEATFTIFNDGELTLEVSEISVSGGGNTFTVDPANFSVDPGASRQVAVSFTPQTAGPVTGSVTVISNDPDEDRFPFALRASASEVQAGVESAIASLTSFSVRWAEATTEFEGETYRLWVDSGFGQLGTEDFNRELAYDPYVFSPRDFLTIGDDPDFPSHIADIQIQTADGADFIFGFIEVNVPPPMDADDNGIPDFFQPGLAVLETKTEGFVLGNLPGNPEFIDGFADVTWSREAGSLTGDVHIALLFFGDEELKLDFETRFDLVRYSGNLRFLRDSESVTTASLEVSLENETADGLPLTLAADMAFDLESENFLELRPGDLLNGDVPLFTYDPFPVERRGQHFLGALLAPYDFPVPYGSWLFRVDDADDADGDGIPNFSDQPGSGGESATENDIEAWRTGVFGADADNPAISGDLADGDFDGTPTLLEYGQNSDPTRADTAGVEVRYQGGSIVLSFYSNPNANDLEFIVQESGLMAVENWTQLASRLPGENWTAVPGVSLQTAQEDRGTRITLTLPLPGKPTYYRLLVRLNS